MSVADGRRHVGVRRLGGILGPVAFITAWAVLGRRRGDGYSAVADPISRLAAVGAPDRVAMTAGMLALAGGIGAWSSTLRSAATRRMGGATALATLGIAVTPLGSSVGGVPHAVAAGAAYAALTLLPVVARRTRGAAAVSVVAGTLLLASVSAPSARGVLQRAGLTVAHAWIVARAFRPAS